MSEYWWGVITPFIAIGGLALVGGAAYALFRAGGWLNSKTHERMVERITIGKNRINPLAPRPERPEYFDKATALRDALLKSRRLWLIRGFGMLLLIVRDYREEG